MSFASNFVFDNNVGQLIARLKVSFLRALTKLRWKLKSISYSDKPRIWIEDATKNSALLQLAQSTVSEVYDRFRNETGEYQPDVPLRNDMTLVAVNLNSINVDSDWILGTIALNFGSQRKELQLKKVFETTDGNWDEFDEHGFDATRVTEISRLAFSKFAFKHPERKTLLPEIFLHGLNAIHWASRSNGCDQIWAIASAPVVHIQDYFAGIEFLPAETVRFAPSDDLVLPNYKRFRPGLYRLRYQHGLDVGNLASAPI